LNSANSVRTAAPSTMPDAHQAQVCARPTAASLSLAAFAQGQGRHVQGPPLPSAAP
jgi:hypothetical protein